VALPISKGKEVPLVLVGVNKNEEKFMPDDLLVLESVTQALQRCIQNMEAKQEYITADTRWKQAMSFQRSLVKQLKISKVEACRFYLQQGFAKTFEFYLKDS